jgi:hypothetical protein
MLTALSEGLWLHNVPYRAARILQLGRRMTVAKLPKGCLWIHSPVPWTPELRAAVEEQGSVQHVIGPSLFHDECLDAFRKEYPAARFHAAPGLAAARPDVRFDHTLSGTPDLAWTGVIEQHVVRGMPKVNEVVFLHKPSRTLILADLCFNLGPDGPFLTKFIMKMNGGAWGRFTPSRYFIDQMEDRPAVKTSIELILDWDFDRVIVGHGAILDTGGKSALRSAFSFLF